MMQYDWFTVTNDKNVMHRGLFFFVFVRQEFN